MKVTTKTATAERLSNQWVMTRTKTGAPRKFMATVGEVERNHVCMCPNGGRGCSHERALMELLHAEAATMTQVAHVGA
jgi:hypothetical protein